MQEFEFYQPQTLPELLRALLEPGSRVIAGGTDILPRLRRDLIQTACLVDLSRLNELCFIDEQNGKVIMGAMTTHQRLVSSPLILTAAPMLAQAAAGVGCSQTRSRGTLGGNIANASPAADVVPPLLALEAEARLLGNTGERIVRLGDLITGPGKTLLEPGEFIHSVMFARPGGRWGCEFQKLGKRSGMAISIANAAALVVLDSKGRVEKARLALGSAAPTAVRCLKAEAVLAGQKPSVELCKKAAAAAAGEISPIDDVRASAEYRSHAAQVLARRVLENAFDRAEKRSRLQGKESSR